jgi:hypothetical protein
VKKFRGLFPLLSLVCSLHAEGPAISVIEGRWGNVKLEEIHKVLESTLNVFIPHSPNLKNKRISVYKDSDAPLVHYQVSENGEYRIHLTSHDRLWCQYVFQFAHELGHIMCRTKRGDASNDWFEEMICEAASLFALKELSHKWSNSPPYPNWASYAEEFQNYRTRRINQSSCPENFQIDSWWKQNRELLSQNSHLRKQNLWMAIQILPMINKQPKVAWSACHWLNQSKTKQPISFHEYLNHWKSACTELQQKEFVEGIQRIFGTVTLNQ